MTLTLRARIFFTLVPLLLLLAVLGTAGVLLLSRLGNSTNAILRENYDSVIAMERLHEALERIDSSFQFAMVDAKRWDKAREQYEQNWKTYQTNLAAERNNITLPGEAELAAKLTDVSKKYRAQGDAFFESPSKADLQERYFGPDGLLQRFNAIKNVSNAILRLNQNNMEEAGAAARDLAFQSLIWFGVGLAVAMVLAVLSAWHTVRTILRPIRAITEAAQGISAGNLDQIVSYQTGDELGQLADAFNTMARRLRDFRESQSAQLLRAQQTSQATIDSFPDAVIVIDAQGQVEMANPAARRLLGVMPRQKGEIRAAWEAPAPLRQPLAEALQGQRDYLPDGFDRVIPYGAPGQERALLPRILTIRDPYGATLGAAVLLQDVTRLRLLDEVKTNLVATASHELKTPLTSLRLAVHLLLEDSVGTLNPKQTELLLDARDNSERLLAVVNNLLDLARLEQGRRQLDVQPERPEGLLRAVADAVGPRAEDKGIELRVEAAHSLPRVAVDGARLGHALRNLVDNALNYTERGRVTLSATAAGNTVTLAVADTGAGIPPEHLPHVFEKFFRVPGQSRGSGTGLGLAIVHEIVTAHGGTITCDSKLGEGTTFRITLPVAKEAVQANSWAL
jgi:NtrC-family two-component system sensor histidine kinase KinB